jgi:hypothetical protein
MIEKVKQHFQHQAWFLLLLPFLFVANGYNDFFGFFPFQFVLVNLLVTIASTLLLYLVFSRVFHNKNQTALFTFYLLVFMLGFGFLHDSMKRAFPKTFLVSYSFLLPVIAVAFFMIAAIIRGVKKPFYKTFMYLNTMVVCICVFEIVKFTVCLSGLKHGSTLIDARFNVSRQFQPPASLPDSAKPDIFFLVFDAMPSSKALKTAWNFDNTALDTAMARKDFYVAADARSNYNLTVLSVSSTLNMDYIPEEKLFSGSEVKMYFRSANSLMHNSLTEILTQQGYQIFQYQPVSFVNKDWEFGRYFSNMLTMNFFYRTFPGRVYRDLGWNIFRINLPFIQNYYRHTYEKRNTEIKQSLDGTINNIKNTCTNSGQPKFIYAHFMLPHDPYVFNQGGELLQQIFPVADTKESDTSGYKAQTLYANKLITGLAEYILQHNKRKTVIVVEGDHGYKYFSGKELPLIYRNFYALYGSSKGTTVSDSSISPVNTFRVILNTYFNTGLPILENKTYYIETAKNKVTGIREIRVE